MEDTAVVFDCAGTLLEKYRVAKDIDTGTLLHQIVSLNFVGTREDYVLAVFELDVPKDLEGVPRDLSIADFLDKYGVELVVVCANAEVSKADALAAVTEDTQIHVKDLIDVVEEVGKNCTSSYFTGTAAVIDVKLNKVPYVLATCGELFNSVRPTIHKLQAMGAHIYIASGDAKNTLYALADRIGVPYRNVCDIATPAAKKQLVLELKRAYKHVVMVGDGINDIPALEAADIGILTVQQKEERPAAIYEAADIIVEDIALVPNLLKNIIMNKGYKDTGSKEANL
ncbi:MAG: HAD-IC family P-type ATPase [Halobacteriota archaeon]